MRAGARECASIGHWIGNGLRPVIGEARMSANANLEICRISKIADSEEGRVSLRFAVGCLFAPDVGSSSTC
jgi:hypothetical protein